MARKVMSEQQYLASKARSGKSGGRYLWLVLVK